MRDTAADDRPDVDDLPGLNDEHHDLQRATAELQREHALLHANPQDIEGHEAHRRKLQAHVDRLHAYLSRIRAERAFAAD